MATQRFHARKTAPVVKQSSLCIFSIITVDIRAVKPTRAVVLAGTQHNPTV